MARSLTSVFPPAAQPWRPLGQDQTARLWDVKKAKELRRFAVVSGMRGFFSPGANYLAVVDEYSTIVLYEVGSGRKLRQWRGTPASYVQDGFLTVRFSPDGATLAVGGAERISLRNAATGAEVYPGHTSAVGTVLLSPDGRTLATASKDGLRLWETGTGKQRCHIAGELSGIQAFAFAADSRTITVLTGGIVFHYEAATGKETGKFTAAPKLPADSDYPHSVSPPGSLSADGKRVAVATGKGIHLFDVAKAKEIRQLELKAEDKPFLRSVTLSPDGRVVGSWHVRRASMDGRGPWGMWIHLWEADTGKHLWRLKSAGPLDFSPDGKTLATVGDGLIPYVYERKAPDSKVRLWDLTTGKELFQIDTHGPSLHDYYLAHKPPIGASFAFSRDGKTLAAAGPKGAITFWNTASGQVVHEIPGPQVRVTALSVAADGKLLVSGGADTTAIAWKWPAFGK